MDSTTPPVRDVVLIAVVGGVVTTVGSLVAGLVVAPVVALVIRRLCHLDAAR